jgi:RNA polymerase sigma-70 factor, ECF subfamily
MARPASPHKAVATGTTRSIPLMGVLCELTQRDVCLDARVSALYEAHRNEIYWFLLRRGIESAVAQDITQDVFVKLCVALRRGDQLVSELGWLHTVAARSAYTYWSRRRKPVRIEFDDLASPEPTPEAQAQLKQRIQQVTLALRALPEAQRQCVHLRSQGLRYCEIAEILGVAISTAAGWWSTAIEHLRDVVHD